MAPDYDLSNLQTEQVDLWICLQNDALCGQIVAEQAERLGSPSAFGDSIVSAMKEKSQAIFSKRLRGVGV